MAQIFKLYTFLLVVNSLETNAKHKRIKKLIFLKKQQQHNSIKFFIMKVSSRRSTTYIYSLHSSRAGTGSGLDSTHLEVFLETCTQGLHPIFWELPN